MRAVITVTGKDMVGIVAKVSAIVADSKVNILEITQSILQEFFAMILLVDISNATVSIEELEAKLNAEVKGMKCLVMHEDIFETMHHI